MACRTMHSLEASDHHRELVDTLVLESPFNNLLDEVHTVMLDNKGALGRGLVNILPVEAALKSCDMEFK